MVGVNIVLNVGLLQVKYGQTFEEFWKEFVNPICSLTPSQFLR